MIMTSMTPMLSDPFSQILVPVRSCPSHKEIQMIVAVNTLMPIAMTFSHDVIVPAQEIATNDKTHDAHTTARQLA